MLSARFSMGPGLIVHLVTPESEAHLVATNLAVQRPDPLTNLVRALVEFSTGTSDISCRWPSEPGGHFIDISSINEEKCGIVVHSFADRDWLADSDWLPRRGEFIFGAHPTLQEAITAFTAALQDLDTGYRDEFGRRWPWPFPRAELSRLVAATA